MSQSDEARELSIAEKQLLFQGTVLHGLVSLLFPNEPINDMMASLGVIGTKALHEQEVKDGGKRDSQEGAGATEAGSDVQQGQN